MRSIDEIVEKMDRVRELIVAQKKAIQDLMDLRALILIENRDKSIYDELTKLIECATIDLIELREELQSLQEHVYDYYTVMSYNNDSLSITIKIDDGFNFKNFPLHGIKF